MHVLLVCVWFCMFLFCSVSDSFTIFQLKQSVFFSPGLLTQILISHIENKIPMCSHHPSHSVVLSHFNSPIAGSSLSALSCVSLCLLAILLQRWQMSNSNSLLSSPQMFLSHAQWSCSLLETQCHSSNQAGWWVCSSSLMLFVHTAAACWEFLLRSFCSGLCCCLFICHVIALWSCIPCLQGGVRARLWVWETHGAVNKLARNLAWTFPMMLNYNFLPTAACGKLIQVCLSPESDKLRHFHYYYHCLINTHNSLSLFLWTVL